MADLDELFAQIPTDEIADKLGADRDSVDSAIKTLVPVLVGGLHQNAADPDAASQIESAATTHRGLLDGGVSVDQVDEGEGQQEIARIFGGNDTSDVASALSSAGAGNSDLLKQLLPILAPIVLAYIGKKLSEKSAPAPTPQAEESSGGLGDILGSILGGGKQAGSDNPVGDILGNILGGKGGNIGDILGGLLGGKK